MILGKSRTARRRGPTAVVFGVCVIEFVPYLIVVTTSILFVESHDIHHGLGVFFLLLLRNPVLLQQPLPLLGQTRELPGLIIIADMGDMDRVLRGRNFDVSWGPQHAVDETGKACLFASPRPGRRAIIAFIGVSLGVGRPVGFAMGEGIHPVGEGGEAGRLSKRLATAGIGASVMIMEERGTLRVLLRWWGLEVVLGAVLIQGAEHAPRLVGGCQLIRAVLLIGEAVGTRAGAGGAVAGEVIPLVMDGRWTATTVLFERRRGRAVSCVGARADVLATATGTTGGGTRIDRGGGVTFQGGGALMTAKNAGTEARGFLVQFAGGSAEFQRESVLTHDGQKLSLHETGRLELGR